MHKYLGPDGLATAMTLLKDYADEKKPKRSTVLLEQSKWDEESKSQTVEVEGVLENELAQLIIPVPSIASQADYIKSGILLTNQGEGTLTFTAQGLPKVDLTVYIAIFASA